MHDETKIGEFRLCHVIGGSRFQAFRGAVKTLAQRTVFVGVAQFAQQSPRFVRPLARLFHQSQRDGPGDPARFGILEYAALENPALPRPILVEPARAIFAQGGTRLGKPRERNLAARNLHGEAEHLYFPSVIARLEFNEVEKRAVAAQPARAAKLFPRFHRAHYPVAGYQEASSLPVANLEKGQLGCR